MFPIDQFIPSRGGVIGRGGSTGFERHRTNEIVGPRVRLPLMDPCRVHGWGGGAEVESLSPSPPHSRPCPPPRMAIEASSMKSPPHCAHEQKGLLRSESCLSLQQHHDPSGLRSVVVITEANPQAAIKRGARGRRRQAHKRTCAMPRCCADEGAVTSALSPVFQSSTPAKRQPARRMAAPKSSC